MKTRRTVKIKFDRIRVATTLARRSIIWCEICEAESDFVTRQDAEQLAEGMRLQGLTIDPKNLHFFGKEMANAMICLNSIINGSNAEN